ncbi:MAG: ATP-dependent helicase [Candidatus Omnitrophica bacterium]|nr:ATP-dependent helicase [Candidatus Omnitrophota bacterium]
MIDFEGRLNPSQLAAVRAIRGPLLVIAGAGSGKTRVIEYRVLYLLENNIPPASILLLTFTRRAAHEMISRACRHNLHCSKVVGGTFHSFAYQTLKVYAKKLGIQANFIILDEADSCEAIRRCMARLGFENKKSRFPRAQTIKDTISRSNNLGCPLEDVLKREYPHFVEYSHDLERIKKEYGQYKIKANYLDYDDLLICLKALLEKPQIRDVFREKYRFIMVDEYQDTNTLQGDITYLLSKDHQNVMVVGDDAQSIYGFRGATHKNIMEFPKRFPNARIIKLEENFRSTRRILDVANAVLANMKNKYAKCLFAAKGIEGLKPQVFLFQDGYKEAQMIAERILELRNEGVDLTKQAILFRSAYVSIPLQTELSRRKIPFQVFGGLKFYETSHIRDVLAHLRVIVNPKDELAWMRGLTLLKGIGTKTAQLLVGKISKSNNPIKVFEFYKKGYSFSKELSRLGVFLKKVNFKKEDVSAYVEAVVNYYQPIFEVKFDDWHLRANDLEALKQIAGHYRKLRDLLVDLAVELPQVGVRQVAPLTLSTIHSAKGLEWEVVFLVGIAEGLLPISYTLDDEEEIEEEQRLFYVAVTRAKARLYFSLHYEGWRRGFEQFNKISRFVDQPNVMQLLEKRAYPF